MSSDEVKSKLDRWADEYGEPETASDPTRKYKELEESTKSPGRKRQSMSYIDTKAQEEKMIEAIDDLRAMKRLAPTVLKLLSGKIPLERAIKESSNETFLMLMKMAFTEGNPKVKSNILMHMLALAGYSATQKHQIERVDPDTPRDALLSIIAGAREDLIKEGIEMADSRKTRFEKDIEKKLAEEEAEKAAHVPSDKYAAPDEEYDYRDYEV